MADQADQVEQADHTDQAAIHDQLSDVKLAGTLGVSEDEGKRPLL